MSDGLSIERQAASGGSSWVLVGELGHATLGTVRGVLEAEVLDGTATSDSMSTSSTSSGSPGSSSSWSCPDDSELVVADF